MRKLIIGLTAMFMIGISAASQPGQQAHHSRHIRGGGPSQQETSTRFGVLSVDEEKRLLFKGQPLHPPIEGNNLLELGEVMYWRH